MVLQLMKANVILSNSQFIVLLRYILSCLRRLKDLLFLHSDGGDVTNKSNRLKNKLYFAFLTLLSGA